MSPEEFIQDYERALATQNWMNVDPLVHENACVTFSNGTVHKGKHSVRKAFEGNFASITDETYSISHVHWVIKAAGTAVYLFEFNWSGLINDKPASGSGRGTSVLINENDRWLLLVEHLGPKAS